MWQDHLFNGCFVMTCNEIVICFLISKKWFHTFNFKIHLNVGRESFNKCVNVCFGIFFVSQC